LENSSRDINLIAHRRWLKTRLGLLKCIYGNKEHKGAIKDPGTLYFDVFPTYKQAKMVAWDILKEYSKPFDVKSHETELTVIYPNGSKICLKGSDKPDSLRGPGLDGLVLDEWPFHDKPEISTRILRPALADKKGWRLKVGTLNGENHGWDDYQACDPASRYLIKASESGVLSAEELTDMKKEMTEEEYLQEMECIPIHFGGQVFKEFDEQVHVVDRVTLDKDWNYIVALDWGLSHNTAVMYCAIDFQGNFIVYDELIDNDKPVDYYAPIIRDKMTAKYDFFVPPDTMKKDKFRQGIRYSVFEEFCEQGLSPIIANNQVHAGINKLKQLFASNKIKISRNCTELIAGLKRYKWKEGVDEPIKIRDDEVDSLRYAVATYYSEAKKPPKPATYHSSEWWDLEEKAQYPEDKESIWQKV